MSDSRDLGGTNLAGQHGVPVYPIALAGIAGAVLTNPLDVVRNAARTHSFTPKSRSSKPLNLALKGLTFHR